MSLTFTISPLIALWVVAILFGVGCMAAAAFKALDDGYLGSLLGKPYLYFGLVIAVLAGLSWAIWHTYYACQTMP